MLTFVAVMPVLQVQRTSGYSGIVYYYYDCASSPGGSVLVFVFVPTRCVCRLCCNLSSGFSPYLPISSVLPLFPRSTLPSHVQRRKQLTMTWTTRGSERPGEQEQRLHKAKRWHREAENRHLLALRRGRQPVEEFPRDVVPSTLVLPNKFIFGLFFAGGRRC